MLLLRPAVPTLFRGFRYHLGENTAVVWDDSVPTITPNRVPVLSWGPRILGEAGGASKDSLMEANNQFDDGVSEPQDIGAGEAASSGEVENPGDVDCVNVRYLRSYIDGTQAASSLSELERIF